MCYYRLLPALFKEVNQITLRSFNSNIFIQVESGLGLLIRDSLFCWLRSPFILDSVDSLERRLDPIRAMGEWLIFFLVKNGLPVMLIRSGSIACT